MKRTGKSGWLRRASALLLLLALALNGCAAPAEKTQAEKTAAYLMDTVTEPSCGSVCGEAVAIADDFTLLIRTDAGELIPVSSGEILYS